MRDFFKPKTWLLTTLMFFIALGLSSAMVYYEFGLKQNINISYASAGDNVKGWAWSSNIGWISFNSTDCDTDGNGFIDTNAMVPGCGGDNTTKAVFNYGVKVDINSGPTLGNFSGYAWSSNVGWISFNRRTCVGGGEDGNYCKKNSDCSSNSCRLDGPGAAGAPLSAPYDSPANLDYNAIYDFNAKTVTGWAKILTLGNDGWVKFNGNKQDGQPWTPGVAINPADGSFSGWAWNANDSGGYGIGWISFNCANDSSCASSNYKVVGNINRPPTVASMSAPNWSFADAQQYGALNAKLDWVFSDPDLNSSESAYQIIANTQNSINNPIFDSGTCSSYNCPKCQVNAGVGQFQLHSILCPAMSLNYNTAYYWWVKVWDNFGAPSVVLKQYDTEPDTDNNDSSKFTFTTYKHEMPQVVDFSWFPQAPSKGEEVRLTSQSKRFNSGNPSGPSLNCTDDDIPAGTRCTYLWTLPTGANFKPGYSSTASTTVVIFNNAGANQNVILTVTDSEGYEGTKTKPININAKLPVWKEVKPE